MQSFLVSVVVVLSAFSHHVIGIPLMSFYPFGNDTGDTALPPNDDESSGLINLTMPYPFFGENRATAFVNNNGVISFQFPVFEFTPESFPLTGDDIDGGGSRFEDLVLIAPYWADVDTSFPGTGTVWYRETAEPLLLDRAASDIQAAFISQGSFIPTYLLIATWDGVSHFGEQTNLTNTFQCVMATNGINSFVIFLYADGEIQWTTGDASNGIGGLGGDPAQVGFNAGDGVRFASVPGSQTADIINIDTTSNVGIPGVWIFRVDEEEIAIGGLDLSFAGDSPRLGVGTVIAELSTNRPGVQIMCSLHRTTFTQDCSNGSVTFTNVPTGGYSLRVVATDGETGDTAEIRTGVFVPASEEFCAMNAINRLVTVSRNTAAVEFSSTGNPTGFRCRVDEQPFFPCTSPVTITGLDPGRHRIRVRPTGCGLPGTGRKSFSVRFDV